MNVSNLIQWLNFTNRLVDFGQGDLSAGITFMGKMEGAECKFGSDARFDLPPAHYQMLLLLSATRAKV